MQRLESVLPGMDIRALIVKDSLVLSVDASAAARRLVFLSSNLGHPDLTQLIMTAPQLLYAQVCHFRVQFSGWVGAHSLDVNDWSCRSMHSSGADSVFIEFHT